MKNYLSYALLSLLVIVADQISKYLVLARFAYAERVNVVPGFFDLTLVYNPGAAFSFLADMGGVQKYIFTVLAFVISGYLARCIVKGEFGRWGNWAAAAVIGGAMGNVLDRFQHGHVIDFLLFYWNNWFYPAFNIADSFICVGVALLLLDGMQQAKQAQKAA